MREYVLHQAQSRQAYGRLTPLVRVVKNWLKRRALRKLENLDDFMLRDIGLTRDDLRLMRRQPLTLDVQWEADRLRLISSRERR
ncbi:MAG: DUF1127 domain-containing protein [Phyllobacteriaceae bacterium]|nr:DUF1127 domain-containing protein [Phyllobacteriaceae bacterium]